MTLMKMASFSKVQERFLPEEISIMFPMPSELLIESEDAASRGHIRSMSAPAKATPSATWDLSPCAFQHLKENWQGWKWKMMRKSSADKRKRSLFDRRVALEEDVAQLQTQLHNERAVRQGLERALGQSTSNLISTSPKFSPKTKELVSEISMLESEVASLEHHVLRLYREVLDQQLLPLSGADDGDKISGSLRIGEGSPQQNVIKSSSQKKRSEPSAAQHRRFLSGSPSSRKRQQTVVCSQTKTRHASLLGGTYNCIGGDSTQERSQQLATTVVPSVELVKIVQETGSNELNRTVSCDVRKKVLPNSAPIPTKEAEKQSCPRDFPGSPNKLSEDLVRCMAGIYCKLADPPLQRSATPSSPSSSTSSSTSTSSAREFSTASWSPRCRADASCDISSTDPFHFIGQMEDVSGAYSSMVEVPWICVDKERLSYAARALRNFRCMVEQLEKVNPAQMNHDERLSFWINIYNALMMHAFLAYGIPRSHFKRMSLLQKATYKVGGYSINAQTIEHSILGCRSRRQTQWLQTLFSSGTRFKAGDERRAFALDKTEPLVCFALCCGGRSDPAIRVYSAKHVREELELARNQYMQASIGIRSESKVLLPRILDWYAREVAINSASLLEWVCQHVSGKQQTAIKKCLQLKPQKSPSNCLEWVPYNCSFRYIFSKDLATRVVSHHMLNTTNN